MVNRELSIDCIICLVAATDRYELRCHHQISDDVMSKSKQGIVCDVECSWPEKNKMLTLRHVKRQANLMSDIMICTSQVLPSDGVIFIVFMAGRHLASLSTAHVHQHGAWWAKCTACNAFCPPGTSWCACAALRNRDGGRPWKQWIDYCAQIVTQQCSNSFRPSVINLDFWVSSVK
jgi:hypothetical protein